MKGSRSYEFLLVETIRRTAQIDPEKGEAIRTRRSRTRGPIRLSSRPARRSGEGNPAEDLEQLAEGFSHSGDVGVQACRAQKARIAPVTRSSSRSLDLLRLSGRDGGSGLINRARHLFPEHCPATPAPMSHLWIAAGIDQPSWEQSPGSGPAERGPEGNHLVRATIGIGAPFRSHR
jgi:hypothetical protein